VHDEDDPCVGEPLCRECFDRAGAVVWNNLLGELWRRTTIYLPRAMARLTGRTQKRLRELVRVSYIKVAEYQPRGLVHLHVVIRLDRAMPRYRGHEVRPPAARFGVELLEYAIRTTVAAVDAPLPDALGGGRVRWGDELEIRPLDAHARREVAGYLAKYGTKSTEQAGGVTYRVAEHQIDTLPVREHMRAYLRAASKLSRDPAFAERRLAACAHVLGYRGHCLTKSRRYSTTFRRAARGARAAGPRAASSSVGRRGATRARRCGRAPGQLSLRRNGPHHSGRCVPRGVCGCEGARGALRGARVAF
jgi:hypothetical protein